RLDRSGTARGNVQFRPAAPKLPKVLPQPVVRCIARQQRDLLGRPAHQSRATGNRKWENNCTVPGFRPASLRQRILGKCEFELHGVPCHYFFLDRVQIQNGIDTLSASSASAPSVSSTNSKRVRSRSMSGCAGTSPAASCADNRAKNGLSVCDRLSASALQRCTIVLISRKSSGGLFFPPAGLGFCSQN